jgi:prepilin-type N-terminal cleavage/methylation domain-containing protein/prepilin-type processing-associated H-X9-DG protein
VNLPIIRPKNDFLNRSSGRLGRIGGLSLIELLAVIAILAILAALVFPIFSSMRASSYAVSCTANLRMLHQATLNFAMDNDGFFPVAKNPWRNYATELALGGYLGLAGDSADERLTNWIALNRSRGPFVLWCPATETAQPRPSFNMATYATNVNVGGTGSGWPGNPPVPTLKTLHVTIPARTALFMDGCFVNGGYQVFVGESGYLPSPVHPPAIFKQADNPKRSVNVVFIDGHVEMRRIGTIPNDFHDIFWKPNKDNP